MVTSELSDEDCPDSGNLSNRSRSMSVWAMGSTSSNASLWADTATD